MSLKIKLHEKSLSAFQSHIARRLKLRTVSTNRTNCPHDCLVEDKARCEVKTSKGIFKRGKKMRLWQFNIHRHNSIAQNGTDFYCLHALNIAPDIKYGAWLIIPYSEMPPTKTFCITTRSLLFKWAKWFNRWDLIKDFVTAQEG